MAPGFEETLAVLVILAIGGFFIYWFIRWVSKAPRTVDPWGEQLDQEVNEQGAVSLCHHCLTPQEHNGWFCPRCGATVGPYSNYMPYIYVFSQGEVLRAGVTERLRPSALIILGFMLLSLGMFDIVGLFALALPIYWFFLFQNLRHNERPTAQT
jgi:hypothetical protein